MARFHHLTVAQRTLCCTLSVLFCTFVIVPPAAVAQEVRDLSDLAPEQRVRIHHERGEHVTVTEGYAVRTAVDAAFLHCGAHPPGSTQRVPRPEVLIPYQEITYVEVWNEPPTRLDAYMGIGALVGLGVGLLFALNDGPSGPSQACLDDPTFCDGGWSSDGAILAIALPVLGAGIGAVLGLAREGEGAWEPIGVTYSAVEDRTWVSLAARF